MTATGRATRALVATALLAGLLGTLLAGGAAAQTVEESDGTFRVELSADGDADVAYTDVYDLDDDEQRAAFEEVRDDEAAREAKAEQTREEMQFITERANERVEREISVGEVSVEAESDGDVGTVTYRFEWENLAAVDGDRVVLAEPFSIYQLDRELVVVAPDGYDLTSATPDPEQRNETTATWPAFTDAEDFEVVATDGDGSDDDGAFGDGGGFEVAVAVGSLLAAAGLARRRQ